MKYNTLASLVLSACSVIGAVSTTEDVQLTPTTLQGSPDTNTRTLITCNGADFLGECKTTFPRRGQCFKPPMVNLRTFWSTDADFCALYTGRTCTGIPTIVLRPPQATDIMFNVTYYTCS